VTPEPVSRGGSFNRGKSFLRRIFESLVSLTAEQQARRWLLLLDSA